MTQDAGSQWDAESLKGLRSWLRSEMSISEPKLMSFGREFAVRPPEQEGAEVTIRVQNDAPVLTDIMPL